MAQNKYGWLSEYCLSHPGVTTDYQVEWQATRYHIGGKMFAMCAADKAGKPIITLKLEPNFGELLRQQYEHIVPGYYMNKQHWNSLYLEGDVPDDVVRDMVKEAYRLVFKSLSKKLQNEILAQTDER